MQLILHQTSQLTQTHFYDCTCLYFRQLEAFHQVRDSFIRSLGSPDDPDYFIDIVGSNDQTFQNVCAFFCFAQVILSTADDYFVTVFYEQLDQIFQIQQFRASMNQGNVVYAKRSLQRCHLEQFVQYNAGICIAFHIDDDTHTFTV